MLTVSINLALFNTNLALPASVENVLFVHNLPMRVRRSKIKLSSLLTVLAVIVFFLSNEENHVYSIRRGDDGVDDDFYDDDETDRHDRDNDRLETSPPTPLPSSTQRPSIGITAYPTNTPTLYPTKGTNIFLFFKIDSYSTLIFYLIFIPTTVIRSTM